MASTLPVHSSPTERDFGALFVPLKLHLHELDSFLHVQLDAFEPEIREFAGYCIEGSGKRLRPALVFFSGWQGPAKVSSELVRLAAVVELVHLATLVHDDIMDGAELRRNRPTVARRYGEEIAVLLGDALLAHAVHLAAQFSTTEVCRAVAESTRRVCAGEIIQTLRRGTANISLDDYRRIIDLKTAELFCVSCRLGSRIGGGAPDGFVEAATCFGRHLGIGYQIYDDLADFFGEEKRIGKTLGTDFANGKLTLPLLRLIEKLDAAGRTELLEEFRHRDPAQITRRIRQMGETGVFDEVVAAILHELDAAALALRPWRHLAPAQQLLPLCDFLHRQVKNLPAPV